MVTPVFKDLGGQTVDYPISKIVPIGENILGTGDVSIQLMNASGTWGNQYFWYTENMGFTPGWYDGSFSPADETLPAGQAIMVSCDPEDVQFLVLGEVELEEASIEVENGWEMFGNNTPVTIHLDDIEPTGENILGTGDIAIQFMNASGTWGNQYFWYTENMGLTPGWYDGSFSPADETLDAGQAIMLSCDAADTSFTMPSPLDAD